MASNYWQQDEPTLGNYHASNRKKQMQDSCKLFLESARKKILKNLEQTSKSNATNSQQGTSNGADVNRMEMEMLKKEIQEYREQSKAYQYDAPHFTKRFRQLRSKGSKIQQELDKMDFTGKEYLQQEKKQLIDEAEQIWQSVYSKAHEYVCDDCEVKIV